MGGTRHAVEELKAIKQTRNRARKELKTLVYQLRVSSSHHTPLPYPHFAFQSTRVRLYCHCLPALFFPTSLACVLSMGASSKWEKAARPLLYEAPGKNKYQLPGL